MINAPRVNYLTNKELLQEIHRSKKSYCSFVEDHYSDYDCIVHSLDQITEELIDEVKLKRAATLMQQQRSEQKAKGIRSSQIKVDQINPEDIPIDEIVWRLMTFDHIPLEPGRSKKPKNEADLHVKLLFPPFKHYIKKDDQFVEVCRSHWVEGIHNGKFQQDQGMINNRLALMFIKLVDRYGQRSNWRGYTYLGEMKGQALMQLSMVGLQFDESRSDNPFAYLTACISNSFTKVLNLEKKNQNIRDDVLIMHGSMPSITRQIDDELKQKEQYEAMSCKDDVEDKPKPVLLKRGAFGRSPIKKRKDIV